MANIEKVAANYVEETLGSGAVVDAKHASDEEHAQTLWQAIREHRKAIGWSVMVSMSVVMEGYDTILMGNFWGYPSFAKKYGHFVGGKQPYQVSAPWQTGLGMASTIGAIFGAWSSSALIVAIADYSAIRRHSERPAVLKVRVSLGHDRGALLHGLLHLHRLLRPECSDFARGSDLLWLFLGCVRNGRTCVCFRGDAHKAERVFDDLRQPVLGDRTVHCCGCAQGSTQPTGSVVIS
jgi:hypothetical protein